MANRNISRIIRRQERYKTDSYFREKISAQRKESYHKNKLKYKERHKKWNLELSQFADKHCISCGILLNWKNKSGVCLKHWRKKKR